MTIHQATIRYEKWLAATIAVLRPDLDRKHQAMAEDPFRFLRATFYRWAPQFITLCPELATAPELLAVGDLHLANYGTWRDAEGRLVWGINDFDEAYRIPYTSDLVRLATSARIAIKTDHLAISPPTAVSELLDGYVAGIKSRGSPFVLSERNKWLRDTVTGKMREPKHFWDKLNAFPEVLRVPTRVREIFKAVLPAESKNLKIVHRSAGLGSLGRERYTAIVDYCGGKIAREVKAVLPSAWAWSTGRETETAIHYGALLKQSIRSADPFIALHPGWVVRRLSPYCSRIELQQLPAKWDAKKLLNAMGIELANVHAGDRKAAPRIERDLTKQPDQWLHKSSQVMADAILTDWNDWRRGTR